MIRLIVRAGDDGAEGSPGGNLSAPRIHMNSHLLRGARIGQRSWRDAIVAAPDEELPELPVIRLIVRAGGDGAEGRPVGNLSAPFTPSARCSDRPTVQGWRHRGSTR